MTTALERAQAMQAKHKFTAAESLFVLTMSADNNGERRVIDRFTQSLNQGLHDAKGAPQLRLYADHPPSEPTMDIYVVLKKPAPDKSPP